MPASPNLRYGACAGEWPGAAPTGGHHRKGHEPAAMDRPGAHERFRQSSKARRLRSAIIIWQLPIRQSGRCLARAGEPAAQHKH